MISFKFLNGKKRALLKVKKDIEKKHLLEVLMKDNNIEKYLKGKKIEKVIFIKNKLINILLNA